MANIDLEALRNRVRALDYVRGTPEQVAEWREADVNSRANLVIEGMNPEPIEDSVFALMMEEGVPPELATRLILDLHARGPARIAA